MEQMAVSLPFLPQEDNDLNQLKMEEDNNRSKGRDGDTAHRERDDQIPPHHHRSLLRLPSSSSSRFDRNNHDVDRRTSHVSHLPSSIDDASQLRKRSIARVSSLSHLPLLENKGYFKREEQSVNELKQQVRHETDTFFHL